MAKLNFNPECENVGGKWHFISETQLLTLVITGGDPFWIKAVAKFPLTSVGLGLKIWSCRERWLLMILHREVLNGVKGPRGFVCLVSELDWLIFAPGFSFYTFFIIVAICWFVSFCWDRFLCEYTVTETEQRKSGWEGLRSFHSFHTEI